MQWHGKKASFRGHFTGTDMDERKAFEAAYNAINPITPTRETAWLCWRAATLAERDRAARVCDDEARIRTEAGQFHPEESESRGRCYAAARAAINCAKGVRNGEVP